MTYSRSKQLLGLLGLVWFSLMVSASAQPSMQTSKADIIRRAMTKYYRLQSQGMVEFTSGIEPVWEVTYGDKLKNNPQAAEEILKTLRSVHFAMTMDANGKVALTHTTDAPPPNDRVAGFLNAISVPVQQAVSSFFVNWNLFMLTAPFPAVDSEYQLEDGGDRWMLAYKRGETLITTIMTKDLIITNMKIATPKFTTTFQPHFNKSEKGLVLSGYILDDVPTEGPGKTHLDVNIDCQVVNGLQMPRKVRLAGTYGASPTRMELEFVGSNLKLRQAQ